MVISPAITIPLSSTRSRISARLDVPWSRCPCRGSETWRLPVAISTEPYGLSISIHIPLLRNASTLRAALRWRCSALHQIAKRAEVQVEILTLQAEGRFQLLHLQLKLEKCLAHAFNLFVCQRA